MNSVIERVLKANFLTPRRKEFLRRRLEGRTLQEIGEAFGVSRERVRQIGEQIKKQLHKNLTPNELRAYVAEVKKLKRAKG